MKTEIAKRSFVSFSLSRKVEGGKYKTIKIEPETPKSEYAKADYANLWCYRGADTEEAKMMLSQAQAIIKKLDFKNQLTLIELTHREKSFKNVTESTVKYSAAKLLYLTNAEKFALITE